MKEMCIIVKNNACPICGRTEFIVFENQTSLYLTKNNKVIDYKELDHSIKGYCTNCGHKFNMVETNYGFIPITKLRSILFDYLPCDKEIVESDNKLIENPMLKGGK